MAPTTLSPVASDPARPLAEAGRIGLVFLLGLELVRAFLATATFYLRDSLGLNPALPGLLALAVFCAPFASPLLRRATPRATFFATAGLAGARLLVQLSPWPALDLAAATLGVACLGLAIPLELRAAFPRGPRTVAAFAHGALLGTVADTALRTAAGTLDLAWRRGVGPAALIALSAALLFTLALRHDRDTSGSRGRARPLRVWPLAGLGPWLFLQLLLFQNVAGLAAISGWSLPASGLALVGADALAVACAPHLVRRGAAVAAGSLSVLLLVLAPQSGSTAGLTLLAAGVPAVALLFPLVAGAARPAVPGARRTPLTGRLANACGVGGLVWVLLLFLYYGSFRYPLGGLRPLLAPLAALAVAALAAGALFGDSSERHTGTRLADTLVPAAVATALVALPLGLHLAWREPAVRVPPTWGRQLRVMTYNLHQGFDPGGRLDLEGLARRIAASNADLVALQEVTRGWVVAGSVDMVSWLSHRLGMSFAFVGTADAGWGNAVLSRYPILAREQGSLPPEDLRLERGWVEVTVSTRGGPLHLVSTHLHHRRGEETVREQEAEALVARWGGRPRTVLAGDLNATPDSPVIARFRRAGLLDAAASTGDPQPTFPSTDPERRLDYVWVTPDLGVSEVVVPPSTASDHRPVVVTLTLSPPPP